MLRLDTEATGQQSRASNLAKIVGATSQVARNSAKECRGEPWLARKTRQQMQLLLTSAWNRLKPRPYLHPFHIPFRYPDPNCALTTAYPQSALYGILPLFGKKDFRFSENRFQTTPAPAQSRGGPRSFWVENLRQSTGGLKAPSSIFTEFTTPSQAAVSAFCRRVSYGAVLVVVELLVILIGNLR